MKNGINAAVPDHLVQGAERLVPGIRIAREGRDPEAFSCKVCKDHPAKSPPGAGDRNGRSFAVHRWDLTTRARHRGPKAMETSA